MSISLDVNFLTSNDFTTKPPATIFDELDGFFAGNKDFTPHVPIIPTATNDSESPKSNDTKHNKRPKVDLHHDKPCVIPSLTSTDFLLNEESHEDQQLYMVEEDGLKPITSPFMVPGIYKKIPRSSRVESEESTAKVTSKNVFISATEKSGKIVAADVFRETYVNLEEEEEEIDEPVPEPPAPPVPDSLTMLAYDVLKLSNRDNIVIDRERNEIIRHQDELNRKTIYRFLTPETLGLTQEMMATLIRSEIVHKPPVKSKRGRPRKNPEPEKPQIPKPPVPTPPPPPTTIAPANIQRTRSGRIVKPVSKSPPPPPPPPLTEADNVEPENAAAFMRNFLQELKDSEYTCKLSPLPEEPTPVQPSPTRQRNIPPDSICPTCNKIFLGKRRMQQHYQSHPDHRPNLERQQIFEEMSLFKFLVSKVQRTSLPEDQRADVFLSEISDLVEQLQARSSRMIRNTSGLQFVNSRTSKVLGIPEGHYSLDVNAIEAPPDPIVHYESLAPPPAPRLDYNLSISLDDTLGEAKLNLSGPLPSEESLLRTVDDLMKEGMKKLDHDLLHPGQPPVIHYDHASDNAVEAVTMKETTQATPILDLSLDLFQFSSN